MKRTIAAGLILLGLTGFWTGCGDTHSAGEGSGYTDMQEQEEPEGIEAGMYKVGADIPAGEYVLVADDDGLEYWQIAKDSTGEFQSIIRNDNYSNRSIITLPEGTYFTFKDAVMYPAAEAPKPSFDKNIVPEGIYKVGTDFPAGEYKIIADEDSSGFYAVYKDSSQDIHAVKAIDNFSGQRYLTVSDGEYLKMQRCYLQLK